MKALLPLLIASLLLAWNASAQVPVAISYQGLLSDNAGQPLANGASPENFEIEFRIYEEPQGGLASLWTERQTVSVFNGSFSTLLGTGDEIVPEPRPTLDVVFNGNGRRYLDITLIDNGARRQFTPRQRMVTTPYAFRAKLIPLRLHKSPPTPLRPRKSPPMRRFPLTSWRRRFATN